ncbi:hypothetical protein Tco_1415483, partial [Tanacetum coccineum]
AKFLILDIPIDRDAPIVVGRGFLYTISGIVNIPEKLFSTFDGICLQTFCAARSDVLRTAESDSDDEEEYEIKRNKFGELMYGLKPAPYLNCNDLVERSLALQTVTNPFRKISVWKKAVSFLGSLPVPLKQVNWKPDYKGCYTKEEEATGQWRTEIRLTDPYENIYIQGFTTKKTDMKLSKYHKSYLSDACLILTMGGNDDEAGSSRALDDLKPWRKYCFPKFTMSSFYRKVATKMLSQEFEDMLRIKLREAGSNEEIFTSVAWIRAFNINEPIYSELCHEFYSTYEFDEVYADDELQTKKIIKFRLCGHAHSLTLLEFAGRLGLYHADELDEEGFNVYFEGGLRSDEYFNAQEYVNVAWLFARWMKRKGAGTQRDSQICCGQFITKIARKAMVLTDDVIRSMSALIYCRDLDTTTLRELIDSEGRLIHEDPQPGVPRVGIPRPLRASMQDLYDRMVHMEIRQEGAYSPPGYAQPQYD